MLSLFDPLGSLPTNEYCEKTIMFMQDLDITMTVRSYKRKLDPTSWEDILLIRYRSYISTACREVMPFGKAISTLMNILLYSTTV